MRRRIASAVVAGALLGGIGFASAADAAQPRTQACIGDLFGGDARENGGPVPGAGAVVSDLAVNQPFGVTFGEGNQLFQAGLVPDAIAPNTCNDVLP